MLFVPFVVFYNFLGEMFVVKGFLENIVVELFVFYLVLFFFCELVVFLPLLFCTAVML